jgi:peptidyl-tRNA hydrolase, PTH1 family
MKLVIGLGNPGKEYEKTRHNIGFVAVEILSQQKEWKEKSKFNSLICETKIGSSKIILAKPQTFMNNSGDATSKIAKFYKIKNQDILIICDDIDLMAGTLRLRQEGSNGGHKGLESVLLSLKTQKIARIKIGVAEKKTCKQNIPSEKYILKKPSEKTEKILKQSLKKIPEIVEFWARGGNNTTASI